MGHGSLLAGRYRLEERVRTGPDGSLWRAVDETLDRPVSVRVVRPGHRYTADVVDAARRAALVEDPRLVRVLDVGEANGSAYIVAEHLVGRTLEEMLTEGPLPAPAARRLVGEAAQALERASTRGLHHLRVTPSALVIGLDGEVKVLGTAVDAALAGIEQDGDPVGADRADAVGLVRLLYAALTGYWPEAPDGAGVVAGAPVPPADLVATVPNDLDTLCAVTLGPHDDGPHSPGELARELAPWPPTEPLALIRGPATVGAGGRAAGTGWAGSAELTDAGRPAAEPVAVAPSAAAALAGDAGNARAGTPTVHPTFTSSAPPAAPVDDTAAASWRGDADDVWSMLAAARPADGAPPRRATSTEEEPLGPFMPPAPLARPPRDQTRFVISVLAGVVVLGLVLAVVGLVRGLSSPSGSSPRISTAPTSALASPAEGSAGPGASAAGSPTESPAGSVTGSPTGSPSGSASAAAEPATVGAIEAIDPQGDGSEGASLAPRAIDGEPSTTWRSDRYNSTEFGGLKKGLGLFLRLEAGRVGSVRVDMPGSGAEVELRTATGPGLDGSTVVATASQQDGTVVLTPAQPLDGGSLLLWFTKVPQQPSGEHRVIVSEITIS